VKVPPRSIEKVQPALIARSPRAVRANWESLSPL